LSQFSFYEPRLEVTRIIRSKQVAPTGGHYSHAIVHDRTVSVSGQLGRGSGMTDSEAGDIEAQTRRCLRADPRIAPADALLLTAIRAPVYITISLLKTSVMQISARLDLTFAALADPTRRAILARLATGEASVQELAEPFDMSQPAISRHLKVLERAGLISVDIDAQRRPRRLAPQPLQEAVDWIERYRRVFEQNYQRLDALLEELKAKPAKRKRVKR
jgi:DNA-binding transcriptional ArsR family regulator